MTNVFKTWDTNNPNLVYEPLVHENPEDFDQIEQNVENLLMYSPDDAKESLIEEKLEGATYPRFGFTTAQKFENAEEYEAWLNEVWDEERTEYIEAATQAIIARTRVLQEDALEDLETTTEQGITRPDSYAPPCPICGMESTRDDEGDVSYACGHYVDVFNGWYHDDELLWEYVAEATHRVVTSHELSGSNDWFFVTSLEGLDDVLTASEVEQRYGLGKGTVRVECNRKSIPARKSGETWLLRRADAEARWGKKD